MDVAINHNPAFLLEAEAAGYLRLSVPTIRAWRVKGTGPRWRKIGGRVVYHIDDLQRFADSDIRYTTDQPEIKEVG